MRPDLRLVRDPELELARERGARRARIVSAVLTAAAIGWVSGAIMLAMFR